MGTYAQLVAWLRDPGTIVTREESATAIETLEARAAAAEAQVAKLKEALKPFAEYMGKCHGDLDNHGNPLPDEQGVGWVYLTQADFRRAREALKDTSP